MTAYCPGCGKQDCEGCMKPLDVPRFCTHCRRRMKVQVVPTGWTATCVEHGTLSDH